MMFPNLKSRGTSPVANDSLNRIVSMPEIAFAASISSKDLIPSGPGDLLDAKLRRVCSTSCFVTGWKLQSEVTLSGPQRGS